MHGRTGGRGDSQGWYWLGGGGAGDDFSSTNVATSMAMDALAVLIGPATTSTQPCGRCGGAQMPVELRTVVM